MPRRTDSEMRTEDDGIDRHLKQNAEVVTFAMKDLDNTKNDGKTSKSKTNILEVEDDEQRLVRLQNLLENMDSRLPFSSTSSQSASTQFALPQSSSSRPHSVPRSEVFSRIEAFLPQITQSNAELLKKAQDNPTSVDIEDITEDQEAYIEMNLGLGVFEKKRRRKVNDSMTSDSDSAPDSHSDSNENDETHSSDSSASHSTSKSSSRSDTDSYDSHKASNITSSSSSEEALSSSSSSSSSSPPS